MVFGTNSPKIMWKDSCPAAATPLIAFVAINVSMLCAVAPIIFPIKPRMDETMKNHLRPKISDNRPTSVNPIAKPAVHEMETQIRFGDGPMAWLMSERVLEGRTHPR